MKRHEIAACSAILVSSALLLIPAVLNGFPFIFPDSGDYLIFTPRPYRSPFYGLFIFFFHLNHWIWGPVIAQAIIVSWVMSLFLCLRGERRPVALVCITAVLTVFSSLPYFVGFIMADIFTPIMFLLMYMLGFHFSDMTNRVRAYLLFLLCIAISSHVSHLTLALAAFPTLAALLLYSGYSWKVVTRRAGIISMPIVLAALATLLFNNLVLKTPSIAPAGANFMMANMVQYGPARAYLKNSCPKSGYKICAYAQNLPETADGILWISGIYDKMGGFDGMRQESCAIVRETIRKYPAESLAMIGRNFISGLWVHEPAAEFSPGTQISSLPELIEKKFGLDALGSYENSAEIKGEIPHESIGLVDSIITPLSFLALACLGIVAAIRGNRRDASLAAFAITAILLNTLLCTAISGVHDRYQARVTWLLPFCAMVLAVNAVKHGKRP